MADFIRMPNEKKAEVLQGTLDLMVLQTLATLGRDPVQDGRDLGHEAHLGHVVIVVRTGAQDLARIGQRRQQVDGRSIDGDAWSRWLARARYQRGHAARDRAS